MTRPYGEGEDAEYFKFSVFLVMNNRCVSMMVGLGCHSTPEGCQKLWQKPFAHSPGQPGGVRLGYTDHTGCHQLGVCWTMRPPY
jgi:hypothetical protein